jgi:hypothetical protein
MKKSALTIVGALAMTSAAFAQGTVNWGFILPPAMTAQTNTTQYSPFFGGGSSGYGTVGMTTPGTSGATFYYELLYTTFNGNQAAIPSLAALLSWQDTGLTATNSRVAGRLVPVNPTTAAVVPWANGTTNSIVLVGWSANLGTSWANVSNALAAGSCFYSNELAFFGVSATGYITPSSPDTNPGGPLFGTTPTTQGLPIFSRNTQLYLLPTVPEPGVVALAGLGGLSLWLIHRRK